ncbi:MAG: cytidine deaminase [Candidatus Coatesbacteria bacterium]|nr:cytidine deaminase [Candidatus Coatesbacteria bacterium]
MKDIDLVKSAKSAAENAIVPFSCFHVGAALLASDGRLFLGCNIENHSLSMSICAEHVALVNALSCGVREFEKIAVWADWESYVTPCGRCRQLIFEFAPDVDVIMANRECEFITRSIKELLPMAFHHHKGENEKRGNGRGSWA